MTVVIRTPVVSKQYVRVSVDKNILDAASVTELMDAFLEADIGADTAELPLERSVLWSRKHLSLDEVGNALPRRIVCSAIGRRRRSRSMQQISRSILLFPRRHGPDRRR